MTDSNSKSTSVFEYRNIGEIYQEIRDLYLQQERPWVIGYSGGKDSTATLQVVWKALEGLEKLKRKYPVYVIASDTQVETPVIVNYIDTTLNQINKAAKKQKMPFEANKVVPVLSDTFWVNLIGRGYPAPTSVFRWCTGRMKIKPANAFIEQKVSEHGEVIMVLGVRKAESATREQLMNTYQVQGHVLRRHVSLRGAYVYAPIADFTTDDVWTYLFQVPSPWGSNNRDLAAMYRNASAGECPLVIDTSTASCGNSRFGCWVCTVTSKDSSMEAMVDNGEEWLEPLLEFRNWLQETTNPEKKREYRDIKGRDGRIILKKDGTAAARTYKLDVSRQMLRKVLELQKRIQKDGPDPDTQLISNEEVMEIRRIWRTERQDWEDSVPEIYEAVAGHSLDWLIDDDAHFDSSQKQLLENICVEYDVPFELLAKLLEAEKQTHGMAYRANIQKRLHAILNEEWRSENEVIDDSEIVYQPKIF